MATALLIAGGVVSAQRGGRSGTAAPVGGEYDSPAYGLKFTVPTLLELYTDEEPGRYENILTDGRVIHLISSDRRDASILAKASANVSEAELKDPKNVLESKRPQAKLPGYKKVPAPGPGLDVHLHGPRTPVRHLQQAVLRLALRQDGVPVDRPGRIVTGRELVYHAGAARHVAVTEVSMLRRVLLPSAACAGAFALMAPALPSLSAQEPLMPDVLSRAAQYVAAYADPSRNIVGEERYKHDFVRVMLNITGGVEYIPQGGHQWVAEVAVVGSQADEATGYPWLEFRDILSLDGKPARDGSSRLGALATQQLAVAGPVAMKITRETSSSLQGRLSRSVFLPRLTFLFLHAANQPRFTFRKEGERKIEGIKTWEVKYQEKGAPTIIQSTSGRDAPSSGTFWIDPATGQVLMSILKNGDSSALFDQMTVTYALDKATGLRLPATMQHQTSDNEEDRRVEGKATYSKWRVVARTGG